VAEQYPEDWDSWPAHNLATGSLHPQEKQGKDIIAASDLTWNVLVVWRSNKIYCSSL
jgi:hypothetical protein